MDDIKLLTADRSERGKLRITGPQRAWFLHQIMTQAFEDLQPGEARDTAMITAHGRMVGFMETLATEDALLLHFEPELRESLPDAIRRYVFATQVEIEDVTEEMGLILVVGDRWRAVAEGSRLEPVWLHETGSLGVAAGYIWCPRAEVPALLQALESVGATIATEEELELLRIRSGVARWGREMDTKTLPQEAGIEERAVHFDKGCYVGQEAMAKIHFRGKVNRRLARVDATGPVTPGSRVTSADALVGVVTSAVGSEGLAILRYTVEGGASVEIEGVQAKVLT